MSKNEGEITSSIVSTLFKKIFSVCAFVGLAAKCVCARVCVWIYVFPLAPCGCLGAAHKCVSALAPVGEKKKIFTPV